MCEKKEKRKTFIFHTQMMIHNGNGFMSCLRCFVIMTEMRMRMKCRNDWHNKTQMTHILDVEMRTRINKNV